MTAVDLPPNNPNGQIWPIDCGYNMIDYATLDDREYHKPQTAAFFVG